MKKFFFLALLFLGGSVLAAEIPYSLICTQKIGPAGQADKRGSAIFEYNLTTKKKRLLLREGFNYLASTSRDGSHIVFAQFDQIKKISQLRLLNIETKQHRLIAKFPKGTMVMVPQISPDGREILFSMVNPKEGPIAELYIISIDGKNQKKLTKTVNAATIYFPGTKKIKKRNGQPINMQQSIHGSFTPNGKNIIFASSNSNSMQIWKLERKSGNLTKLTKGQGKKYPHANASRVSLDGRLIVFWSGYEGNYGEIWKMDINGENLEKLTETVDPRNSDDPEISPDNIRIAFGTNGFSNPSKERVQVIVKNIITGKNEAIITDTQKCAFRSLKKKDAKLL